MIQMHRCPMGAALACALLASFPPPRALAQQGSGSPAAGGAAPAAANVFLALPTGDRAAGNLLLEVAGPAEVPVGRNYDYEIRATNISKNLILEEIRVHQTAADGVSIEKSDPGAEGAEGHQGGETRWSIPRLAPGESRVIKVTAMAEKEGQAAGCLRATYEPSLCLKTRFVKPAIQVTKEAPKEADLCDPLAYRYVVKNTGSGAARGLTLRDRLADGLLATDGRNALEFDVGTLEPGQSREFTASLQADKPGDYGSRAVAKGADDLEAHSGKPSTAVRQAKLAVSIQGPEAIYARQPTTYRARVKNEGGAPAREARLRIDVDGRAKVVRMSRSDPSDAEPSLDGGSLKWDLGTVEPGKDVEVSFTTVGQDEAELKHLATATSACSRGGDLARAATATARTRLLTFPALLLQLVDRTDPVRVGDSETYRVSVLNQGSGADRDVKIVLSIPEEFQFAGADGPAEAKADGRTVTLGPIGELQPRARADWDVRFKADRPGDVRLKATLTSGYLSEDRPAISVEPTRIIGPGVQAGETTSKDGPRPDVGEDTHTASSGKAE